jgi:transposase
MEPAQSVLLEIPEQPEPRRRATESSDRGPKLKPIDREQGLLRPVIVEELVGPDHRARAIWDLTGELDLQGFYGGIRSREGQAGNSAWDPRLLLSIWLYSYSEQVSSAREIARLMEYEPGLLWLSGLGEVNYHTLADFRSQHESELKALLAELLGLLSTNGMVSLELVAHDGTKVRAQAGADTFRRQRTLEEETAKAEAMMEAIEREEGVPGNGRREAARQRAAHERQQRMKTAAEQLRKVRETKSRQADQDKARVSLTEPEARVMKHGDGGLAPSYNVQLSTDAANQIIVGVQVTQCASDSRSLAPAMDQLHETFARYPDRVVADGGFTNHGSMVAMRQREVDFYGSLSTIEARQAAAMKAAGIDPAFRPAAFQHDREQRSLQCPAGRMLTYVGQSVKRGERYHQFRAQPEDCGNCAHQSRCCPRGQPVRLVSIRLAENAEVAAFRAKMETAEAKGVYKKRGPTAEFANCWIKEKIGLRKFRLRGLAKVTIEAIWAVLTYDVMRWVAWRKSPIAAAA